MPTWPSFIFRVEVAPLSIHCEGDRAVCGMAGEGGGDDGVENAGRTGAGQKLYRQVKLTAYCTELHEAGPPNNDASNQDSQSSPLPEFPNSGMVLR